MFLLSYLIVGVGPVISDLVMSVGFSKQDIDPDKDATSTSSASNSNSIDIDNDSNSDKDPPHESNNGILSSEVIFVSNTHEC
jgi:hypothetical protein